MELGTLAEWAGAVAALLSAVPAVIALYFAMQANSIAKQSREEARDLAEQQRARERERDERNKARDEAVAQREYERDQRDRERDRRLIAGSLHAWWAKRSDDDWGLAIANEGAVASVFYNVKVEAEGNNASDIIDVGVLPPGKYFVKSKSVGGWDLPETVQNDDLIAITRSKKHCVNKICFTDQLGTQWEWTKEEGLKAT